VKFIQNAINAFIYIAVAAIVIMLCITFADVVGRMIFSRPIVGATEICEILMAVMLTAMGGSLLAGKTVQVDVLMDTLPKRVSLKADSIVLIISAAFCLLVGVGTFLNGLFSKSTHRVYTFLEVPQWPFLLLLACSFVIAGIASVLYIRVIYANKDKERDVMAHSDLAILEDIK
jgi:TRAP-type C4-dicarboxylate transport system permease small subunit